MPKTKKEKSAKAVTPVISVTPQTERIEHFSCTICKGTSATDLAAMPATDYCGVAPDGSRYTRVERMRVICDDCSQQAILMKYVFNPNDWKE